MISYREHLRAHRGAIALSLFAVAIGTFLIMAPNFLQISAGWVPVAFGVGALTYDLGEGVAKLLILLAERKQGDRWV